MTISANLTSVTTVPKLPPRQPDSHKGTYGKVVVIAGSLGMSGAAVLSGTGSLRGGAGLVQLLIPEAIIAIVATSQPCYMTTPLPADGSGRLARAGLPIVLEHAGQASAVVVGPGLGQSDDIATIVTQLIREVTVPLLIDADALNVLGAHPAVLKERKSPFAITPHPGEFARLVGSDTKTIQASRQEHAVAFARECGGVVVLKGAGTIVTDGQRIYTNTTGNPGMATGGSGDVLSGLLGALLAQGMPAFDAAVLGTYLHGLAGDLARDERTEVGLIASDLLEFLPMAYRSASVA